MVIILWGIFDDSVSSLDFPTNELTVFIAGVGSWKSYTISDGVCCWPTILILKADILDCVLSWFVIDLNNYLIRF